LVNLGEAYRRLGDWENAAASLRRAIALQPGLAEAHYNLALVFESMGRPGEAVDHFRSAILLKPSLPHLAHMKLAIALRQIDKIDESLSAWSRAAELDPGSAAAHTGRGTLLLDQGRVDEALASFRRALELRPDDCLVHSHIVYDLGLTPDSDAAAIKAEAVRWREQHASACARGLVVALLLEQQGSEQQQRHVVAAVLGEDETVLPLRLLELVLTMVPDSRLELALQGTALHRRLLGAPQVPHHFFQATR
jgi:tetratricopeptide (TPR) repeat protein